MNLFTQLLMDWHKNANERSLPWKGEKDPYKIWLSEIMLQQTRTEQGIPYYLKFIDQYPTINQLASAPEEELYKMWQGLGYYSRCRNMIATAKKIAHEYEGIFPREYQAIRALPGVGDYTAAAIASFAYNQAYAVVDGNVIRVLSRYFRLEEDAWSTQGKKYFAQKAQQLLDKSEPALYNQAIMDLGATICTPRNPQCNLCPLKEYCKAYKDQVIELYPRPKPKPEVKERILHYLILNKGEKIYMQKRRAGDFWANLYEPFRIDSVENKKLSNTTITKYLGKVKAKFIGMYSQRLTHRLVTTYWYEVQDSQLNERLPIFSFGRFYPIEEIKNLALPKSISFIMSKKNYF